MTPPASTEQMYLISESELKKVTHFNWMEVWDRVRARGPVTQQAPEEQIPNYHRCLHKEIRNGVEFCHFHDEEVHATLAEHDAALIAQEREKWERERAEEHRTYESCHKHFACPDGEECWYSSADYYWDCGEGATRLSKAMAQAREDVLSRIKDRLNTIGFTNVDQFIESLLKEVK